MKDLDLIYFAARVLPPESRPAYLDKVCGGDLALRTRVEQMLAVADQAEAFITDLPEDDAPEGEAPGSEEAAKEEAGRGPVEQPKPEKAELPDQTLGTTLGPYRILERVGEGGCGVVYVAKQMEPVRRRVAVKVIKPGMDTKQVVARFEAERQALAMMDHPNIAKVLDAGTTGIGRPYFVMELVRGVWITDYCEQADLSARERLDLFIKVCHAIQHAHQKGVIHRDIKPSNILVTLHDGVPVPKVIDFGIAKATEGRLSDDTVYTQLHHFIGTPAYMSPEQAEMSGLDIDTRSDIYSLGVLLYELLAGSTPFDAKELLASGLEAMRKTIREKDPLRPSTKLSQTLLAGEVKGAKSNVAKTPSSGLEARTSSRRLLRVKETISVLKGDLDWIVMKCLEKDRSRRYETANGLAADLQRHLNHEPVVARPPSASYRFQKTFRRNKLTFVAAGAVAGALLLGVIVSTWQAVRATRAKQAENVHARVALVERDRAVEAENSAVQQRDLAQQRLYDSLIREAQSIRTIRPLGFRRQLIDRIQKALAIPRVSKDLDALRTEVAQCLGDALSFDPVILIDFPSAYLDVAVNSDGSLVACGTKQGQLILYETSSGKAIHRLEIKAPLDHLAFAPDGQSLFGSVRDPGSKSADESAVKLAEWRRGGDGSWSQQSERPMAGLRQFVVTTAGVIAVLEDSSKREIRLIQLATDRLVGSVPMAPGQAFPAAFDLSSDFRFAAYVTNGATNQARNQIEVWDLAANKLRTRLLPGFGRIRHLDFSRDSRFLCSSSEYGFLVFDTSQFEPFNTYQQLVSGAAVWCGEGTHLAIPYAQENGVRICPVGSGLDSTRLTTQHQVKELRSSLDGSVLLVVPFTGPTFCARLTGHRERRHLAGHVGGVPGLAFSADGRTLASTGKDATIRLWDVQTGQLRRTWSIPRGGQGQSIGFSPDGRWLASGNYQNNQVLVWAVEDGRLVLTLDEDRWPQKGTWSAVFSPDGRILVAAGTGGVRGWELVAAAAGSPGPALFARELFRDPGGARNLAFHPSGEWIAFEGTVWRDGKPFTGSFIRRLGDGEKLERFNTHNSAVQSLGIDAVGRTLVHMTSDRVFHFFDLQSHTSVRDLSSLSTTETSSTYILNFKISKDGSKVAVANHNGRGINIHDLASGRRLYTLPDDAGSIWWLDWHPDGRHLAVARGDGDISLWSLDEVESVLAEAGVGP